MSEEGKKEKVEGKGGNPLCLRILKIQSALVVRKTRKNQGLPYSYRNLDDIYAGLKPLLLKHGVFMSSTYKISDDGRFLSIFLRFQTSEESQEFSYSIPVPSEPVKGQSLCQTFGAVISYGTKYALSALFLLDNNAKDFDEMARPEGYK